MVKDLTTYLEYGNLFCGIEHTTKNGNEIIISTTLKKLKKELEIDTTFEVNTIEEVSREIKNNQHASLIINNNNVLSKQIDSQQNEPIKLVYKAFPNINIDDFYYEVLSEKHKHFVSLCRRDYVEEIIDTYKKYKICVIAISFGNNSISNLKSFFTANEIYSSNSKILIEDGLITKVEKNKELENQNYNLNGLMVSDASILSFSGALNTILKTNSTKTNFGLTREELLDDFKQIRFFNQFIKFAGLFLLVGLLINFFVFNHYFNKVNELSQISEINQSTKTKIVKLNESVSKKQKMVDDLLKSKGSKSSFYVNELIQSLPKSILLSETNYQPVQKRIKANKEIELNFDTIRISGVSNNSESFSNWVSQLEKNEWIEKINIEEFGSASNYNSHFIIKIDISND